MPDAADGPSVDYVVVSRQQDAQSGNQKSSNAATGASAAGVRAVSAQFVAFYFRAPIKAFSGRDLSAC